MKSPIFSSPQIAKEMKHKYGNRAKKVRIEMLYEEEVKNYVMKIEEAHKKAAESKLHFH
ncbi:MAG: hypothetical protein HW399_330 [Dehalococcoidia bacterium]|nr:hypothetical protein [Dehalococcoidia bacterium]